MRWYLEAFRKYAVFNGRAHRTAFWMFTLVHVIVTVALAVTDVLIGTAEDELGYGVLGTIYGLAALVPSLAVGARRLHDMGRSGWWQLIVLIPLVGLILLIVWWATESDAGSNDWGPEPGREPEASPAL